MVTKATTATDVIKVFIADPLSEDGIFPLREEKDLNLEIIVDTGNSQEELIEKIKDVDALIVRSATKVTREVIEAAKNLKLIGRAGVGVDNIDLQAATEHGIIVVNAPDGNTNSAAEHTIAMMTSLARHIPQAYLSLKNGKWDRKTYVGVELKNKTLGVIGLGRIGTEVAFRAKGQRMNIMAYDPFLTEERAKELGVTKATVDEICQQADFITVHTPLLPETKNLINKEKFALMKPGVRIINCARGGIINEDDLYDAIVEGKVAGAALDVFVEEPATDHKLLTLPQVIATPHLGASTVEAQESVAVDVSNDIIKYFKTGTVTNPVNMPSIPKELLAEVEPFFELAEKLGAFLSQVTTEPLKEINLFYAGEIANYDVRPLTANTLKGYLKKTHGENVNDVNARYLTERVGVKINENKTTTAKGFTNLITVEVITENETHSVAGTLLNGLGARIVKVENFVVDVIPEGHLLYIKNIDKPGAIGRVATKLAEKDVNIATMQVGRKQVGGAAVMILSIDNEVTPEDLVYVEQLENIDEVKAITL
ncbi:MULTISPECIES: phosphoglycerate dehydrogenase [Ureibacillus]|jgi:D-3-phosphoglycerate dehydrogenase / 2-oxoglutarate reductase|uniref:D-3-phosphoglycerate dehydrogenase n=1 Tax=Ureibacillus thermosphaericus TaxID=51173 RepID=A0A840PUT8_URETH|nr:phosphoglycerate dehydrogenase [Ureibacillus thermosphaericus]MBB5149640.1 D-3-phosphoglycerate dehydrogenase [Ureibacillus thermosphaericus]NKZ32450.1 phosphoglycerate dehydrogenase [Ureibacillus thermosphaericus]